MALVVMSKGKNSNAGCATLLVVFLPFWWVYDKCTGGDEQRSRDAVQASIEEANRQSQRLADARRQVAAEAEQKAKQEQSKAAEREAKRATLAALQPYHRAQMVQQCAKDECPEATPDAALVIQAAKTPAERKQLQALNDRIEKAQARLSAPLRCCDGSDSPSCTCGGGHRGCCSRHGGVCGCSAD